MTGGVELGGEESRRVLMTTDTVGGVWTYAIELSRALCAGGSSVTLAAMGGAPSDEQAAEAAAVPGLDLAWSDFALEWMQDPWRDVDAAGRWLLDLEARLEPDVVHLNGYAHGALPWQAPVLMVGHSCVLSWWRAVKGEEAPPAWNEYRRRVRRGLSGADLVVAPTAAMLAALEDHHGPLSRTRVIHNGRGADGFAPEVSEPFVLAVGRLWDEAKNVNALTAVAGELVWPVYLAGASRHPDGRSASFDHCRALGRLTNAEVARWMGRAAVYAHPARYEPFGLSVLEAALSGCALLLGDIASLREVWNDAALFVDPGDADALRDGATRLIDDDALREVLSRRARARALELTPSAMAASYRACYAELTERKVAA